MSCEMTRGEEGAVVDLLADFGVPGIAAMELAFIAPDVESRAAERLGEAAGGGRIVATVAEEDRPGGRVGSGDGERSAPSAPSRTLDAPVRGGVVGLV